MDCCIWRFRACCWQWSLNTMTTGWSWLIRPSRLEMAGLGWLIRRCSVGCRAWREWPVRARLGRLQSRLPSICWNTSWESLCSLRCLGAVGPGLLRAEIARQRGDRGRALTAYEEALLSAQRHSLTLDEVLICQGRALMEDQLPWVWRNRAQTALRRWRALPATVSFAGQEVSRMLDACLQVTSADNLAALGCALMDLLWLTLGGECAVVVDIDMVPFACWNATDGLGRESIESVLESGEPPTDGAKKPQLQEMCVPSQKAAIPN